MEHLYGVLVVFYVSETVSFVSAILEVFLQPDVSEAEDRKT